MITILTIQELQKLIQRVTIKKFFALLITELETAYGRWHDFQKSPRHATHVENGVMELMPISDDQYYTFKYVNGHPGNTQRNRLTVAAVGMIADVKTGYPLFFSEMTLLTAFRTAATSALAAQYLAKKNSHTIGIIGTGAQSEFQVMAQSVIFPVKTVRYFDIHAQAMKKFQKNLSHESFQLIACKSAKEVLENCDIITTATAQKSKQKILMQDWLQPGLHINGIGGDTPGKTELDAAILDHAKIVVEYFPQSKVEGEIQSLQNNEKIYAELWELVSHKKKGRVNDTEITLFDSVGFALEDYAILKLVYTLCQEYKMGVPMDLVPDIKDPRDLFELFSEPRT